MTCPRTQRQTFVIVLIALFLGSTTGLSQESDSRTAVEIGQDALQAKRLPWYDSNADTLQRTELPIKKQPVVARDWTYTTPTGGGMNLRWLWRLLQYVVWGLLGALFAYLLFLAIKSMTGMRPTDQKHDFDIETRTEADRIENLPFQLEQRTTEDLLDDAFRLYEAGNYNEAIVYLFSHQLVQLDQAHLIRLTKGKTNRQYATELKPRMELRSIVRETMLAFEDVFFGHYELSKERFESCWQQMERFRRELQVQRDAVSASPTLGAGI